MDMGHLWIEIVDQRSNVVYSAGMYRPRREECFLYEWLQPKCVRCWLGRAVIRAGPSGQGDLSAGAGRSDGVVTLPIRWKNGRPSLSCDQVRMVLRRSVENYKENPPRYFL